MKKKTKIKLSASAVMILNLGSVISCSNENNSDISLKDKNLDKLIQYFSENNFDYFSNLKENISSRSKINLNEDQVNNLISFLNHYKTIIDFKMEEPYKGIEIYFDNTNIINERLKKFDKIININDDSFLNVTEELLEEIQDTIIKLKSRNSEIIENNNALDGFINRIQEIQIENSNILNLINKNIMLFFNNKKNRSRFFEKLESIIEKNNYLNQIIEVYKDADNEEFRNYLKILKVFLNSFDGQVELNSILNQFEEKTKILIKLILDNDLRINNLKKEIKNLEAKISFSKVLTNLEKEKLILETKEIIIYEDLDKVNKKFQNLELELDKNKNNFINNISEFPISLNNKKYLENVVFSFDEFEKFKNFENKFKKLLNNFESINNKIVEIQTKITSNTFKSVYQLQFYKKLVKFKNLINSDNQLEKINILNLDETNLILENLISEYSNIIIEEQNDNNSDSKALIDLFREETENNWSLNLTENASKYNLEDYSYSASHSFENSKILFDNFDTDEVDYEIIDLMLDEENRNNLIVKVKVFLKSNPEINYELISSKLFSKDVNQIIDDISFNNFDQFFSVDYEEIKKLTLNEFLNLDISKKLEYFKTEKTWISNFFKFEIKNDFEYIDDRLFATFNILFNKQVIKSWKIPTIKTINFLENKEEIERYRDSLDLEKIMQIIRGNTSSLMTKIKFKKDAKWSHINYLASDAKKAFEEIYELPKYGKYEIFIKDIKNVNNFDGRADLILWYKENGVEAPINNPREVFNNLKRLGSFKLLNFDDLIPENGKFFEANDFENSIESPSQAHIDAINSINESNFALRMSYGIFRDVNYRSINVLDMIEQQAFIKMEYLLEIKNGENRKGENFENDAYVPLSAKTYDKEITVNTTNLSDLKNNYFIYYYDVKAVGKRGMSFKLGFINKRRNEIRYTTDKEYTLINIVNDFQQSLYPEIMVNNIKLSDLEINYDLLSQKTALYYTENMNELNEVIKLRSENDQIRYKNYYLPVRLFKVAELKKITNDEAYIRFSVLDKNNSAVLGNTWYKIKGFLTSEIDNSKQILNFSDENLKTIQDSKNSITRERVIEPFWKDLIWSLDKNINTAYWTLKKKYLEQTFLRTNTKNRILKFNILANSLVNNSSKNGRVRNFDNSISLEVNFDDLIKKQSIEFRKTSYANDLKINYFIHLSWNEEKGIDFKISMEDNDNKIIIDEPEAQRFEQGITFDRTRAFIILPAAVKTVISYTNDEELEDFKQNQNRFDYNEVEYNEYNQPILFSSDLEFQKNREIYHPNQNVKFKLHEGYKLNVDYLRVRQYRGWDIVETAYSRAALYDGSTFFGTIGFLGKVNNNPNDATFYVLTNHHVEGSGLSNFNDVVGNNFLAIRNGRNYAFAPDRIGSNVNRFYNLRTSGATSIFNNQIKIIWTGKEQISKDGRVTNKTQDLTMFVIDLNSKLREARSAGNMQVVWKIENLMKKSNVKMDIDYRFGEMSVPNIREISTMGWPGTRYSGSINRRPALASDTTIRVSVQNNYVQVYNGGGASGSGMFLNDDSYIATWTAGSGGPWSQGYRYDDRSYNFFGINWENENPLTLKNYRSVASQIFKANLRYPEKFDLPWFLKEINN